MCVREREKERKAPATAHPCYSPLTHTDICYVSHAHARAHTHTHAHEDVQQNLCVVCVATYLVNGALFKLTLRDYNTVAAQLRRSSSSSVGARARGLVALDRVARGESARITSDTSDDDSETSSNKPSDSTKPKADTKETEPSPSPQASSSFEASGKNDHEAKATKDALKKDTSQDAHAGTDADKETKDKTNKDPDGKPV